MEFVSIDVTDGVATIRLDRPKMNAISVQVQADLREAAAEVTERDDVRAVVLWGGERVFAAGNDVKEMADLSYADMVKVSASVSSATTAIARIPKPVVAAVNGYALGGGCELALVAPTCASRPTTPSSASPRCSSASSPAPAAPSASRAWSVRAGPRTSSSPAASSRPTRHCGSASSTGWCRPTRSSTRRVTWARQFSGAAALAVRAAKECIDRGSEVDLDTGLEIERQQFAAVFATEDRTHGMTSFVENGPGQATFVGR